MLKSLIFYCLGVWPQLVLWYVPSYLPYRIETIQRLKYVGTPLSAWVVTLIPSLFLTGSDVKKYKCVQPCCSMPFWMKCKPDNNWIVNSATLIPTCSFLSFYLFICAQGENKKCISSFHLIKLKEKIQSHQRLQNLVRLYYPLHFFKRARESALDINPFLIKYFLPIAETKVREHCCNTVPIPLKLSCRYPDSSKMAK